MNRTLYYLYASFIFAAFISCGTRLRVSRTSGGADQYATGTPTVSLAASSSEINVGETVLLTWSSSNAQSCTLVGLAMQKTLSTDLQGQKLSVGPLENSETFVLRCINGSDSDTAQVSVRVLGRAPSAFLVPSATQVPPQSSVILTWTSVNSDECQLKQLSTGLALSQALGGTIESPLLAADESFVLACKNSYGSSLDEVLVRVTSAPITLSLESSLREVAHGGSVSLSWSSSNATYCQVTELATGLVLSSNLQGLNFGTPPLTTDSVFSLSCSNSNDAKSVSAFVRVLPENPPPTLAVSLLASASQVNYQGNVTLYWSTANAKDSTSCALTQQSNNQLLSSNLQGETASPALLANETFVFACTDGSATDTKSVSVQVINMPVTSSLSASPTSIDYGGSATLTWSSSNAVACTLTQQSTSQILSNELQGQHTSGSLTSNESFSLECHNGAHGKTIVASVTVAPECGGTKVGGYCWYWLGREGIATSCTEICSTHGGYNSATATYGAASDQNCKNVAAAFGITSHLRNWPGGYGFDHLGCDFSYDGGGYDGLWRFTDTTTANGYAHAHSRFCACNR